jgi:hypothetical protein
MRNGLWKHVKFLDVLMHVQHVGYSCPEYIKAKVNWTLMRDKGAYLGSETVKIMAKDIKHYTLIGYL